MFGKKEPEPYEPYFDGKNIIALDMRADHSYSVLDDLIGKGYKVISGASISSGYYANPAHVIILQRP